jgi:hypothetical protein
MDKIVILWTCLDLQLFSRDRSTFTKWFCYWTTYDDFLFFFESFSMIYFIGINSLSDLICIYDNLGMIRSLRLDGCTSTFNNLLPCPSVSPEWFLTTQYFLIGKKMFWSDPKRFGQVQIILVKFKLDFYGLIFIIWTQPKWSGPNQNELDLTKINWTRPKLFGRSKIILDP